MLCDKHVVKMPLESAQLLRHALAICDEHTFRYGTIPHTRRVLEQLPVFDVDESVIPNTRYQAMPDEAYASRLVHTGTK